MSWCSAAVTAANADLICTCTLSLVLCQLCLATFTDDAYRCDLGAVCVEEMEQVEVSPNKVWNFTFKQCCIRDGEHLWKKCVELRWGSRLFTGQKTIKDCFNLLPSNVAANFKLWRTKGASAQLQQPYYLSLSTNCKNWGQLQFEARLFLRGISETDFQEDTDTETGRISS